MNRAVPFDEGHTPRRSTVYFVLGLIAFEAFLIYGLMTDHFWETLSNGAMICLSCIGVG